MTGGTVHLQGWPGRDTLADAPPRPFCPVPALASASRLVMVAAADCGSRTVERFGMLAWRHLVGATTVSAGLAVLDPQKAPELASWARGQTITTAAGMRPWQYGSLAAFCHPYDGPLRRLTYGRSGWLVSADLGRLLGLIAERARPARGAYEGGFTLYPVGWSEWHQRPDGRGGPRSVSPHLPPLRIVTNTATSYRVTYGRPPGGAGFGHRLTDGSPYPGRFLDVVGAAFPFDRIESSDLADHAEAFGLGRVSVPGAVSVDPDGAGALGTALDVVCQLAELVDDESRQWLTTRQDRRERVGRIDLRFTPSPGTLAGRIDERSRAVPMLSIPGAPDDRQMRRWIGAHHGGWLTAELAGAGIFPAADIDIHAGYPAMYQLLGCPALRTAERHGQEDVRDDLLALLGELARGDVTRLLDRATWQRFGATLCEAQPAGETWPVQSADAAFPDGHAAMRPLTSVVPLPFAWPDVALAALRAGRVPDVRSAVRLVPVGRQPQARARFPLYGGRWAREGEDPVLALVRLRDEAKRDDDHRLAAQLRVVVNALCYGNAARIDQRSERRGRRAVLVEHVTRSSFPPVAAAVTSACRLAVGLAEHLIVASGGTVASRDTDGLLLASSPEGGPVTLVDGRRVGAISWADLDGILQRFDGLAPFGPGVPFWKVPLREHDGRPLSGVVLRVKRYALGTFGPNGELCELVKATEHGLGGQVVDPPGLTGRCPEGQHLWTQAVAAEALRRAAGSVGPVEWPWEADVPTGTCFPQLQRCQAADPSARDDVAERYGLSLRPFGLYVLGSSRPMMGAGSAPPVAALDPGGDLSDWRTLSWRSAGGTDVQVTTDVAQYSRAHVLGSVGDKALRWLRPRALPVAPMRLTDPRMLRLVGRGGRLLEARAAGDTDTPTETLRVAYPSPDLRPLVVERVRAMGPAAFAAAFGVPLDTAKRWSNGTRRPDAQWLSFLLPLLGTAECRRCALHGCSEPVSGRRTYCSTAHAETGRKRAQRSRRQEVGA